MRLSCLLPQWRTKCKPGDSTCGVASYGEISGSGERGFSSSSAPQIVYPLDEDYNGDGTIQPWEDIPPYGQANPPISDPDWAPHYFCEDTGLIDGGPTDDGTASSMPALNVDICEGYTQNQLCDDGGPGASGDACPLGTDVTDCCNRYYADTRESCLAKSIKMARRI